MRLAVHNIFNTFQVLSAFQWIEKKWSKPIMCFLLIKVPFNKVYRPHYQYKDTTLKSSEWAAEASELGVDEWQTLTIWDQLFEINDVVS